MPTALEPTAVDAHANDEPAAAAVNHNLYVTLRAGFAASLDEIAIETGDGPALHYSWRDLDRGTAMLANLLAGLALPAGSRVAVQTEKSVEALMLYLAVLRAGLVYVPLNIAYRSDEITYFLGDAEPAVVVCTSRRFGWIARLAFAAGATHVYTLDDDRGGTLLQRAAVQRDHHVPVQRGPDDLAAILYTSGTTGRSKGAMLSHGNLASNARVLHAYWGWRQGDVLIHALPIFHVHGLFIATHAALINGSRLIWFAKFEPRPVAERLADATVFMGVPTLYVRLLAEPAFDATRCRTMRLFISGSAPLLIDTYAAFERRSGHAILERYGMSETLMLTSNPCDAADGERRGGTVGKPLPGVDVRTVDTDGAACASGTVGSVEVRGPNVFSGYWRMPEKTANEFTADGWFRTGDVGRFDADGYLTIVGRAKDLVITGGYNVYPAEVEALLNELPGVAESAVIGVPHADFGEAVVAVVVALPRTASGPAPEPAQLIATLKSRIANFKVPKRIVVVADLPRNAMGKVQKNVLRAEHAGMFAAG
jgi:malonyl-CoA/methylmalonyl-CoA synthetase